MKINIIGGSGTGKSYISNQISKMYSIPHFDLDNIFWDNTASTYGVKTSIEKRTEKLNAILSNENWIIEGVYYSWLSDSFKDADKIFILNTSPIVFNFRIIKRFIKRKLGFEEGKKETIKSLKDLILWTNNYQKLKMPKILEFLEPYKNKVIVVDNTKELLTYINSEK